jgi:hypothetical protein
LVGGRGRLGVPRDGLIRSGATSGHTERGALDNDSEAAEEGTPYNVPAYTYHYPSKAPPPPPPPPPANFKSTPLAIFVGAGRGGKTGTIFEDHIFLMCPSLTSPPPPTLSFQHKKLYSNKTEVNICIKRVHVLVSGITQQISFNKKFFILLH